MTDRFESRYPDYNALASANSLDWDEQTWKAVQDRVTTDPAARFLTTTEMLTLEAVAERIIPQPDRSPSDRVPIAPWIDAKLFNDRRDGYRYEGMPPQRVAWRSAIEGIEQTSREIHGRAFTDLSANLQDEVLRTIERGNPPGAAWGDVPAALFFRSVLCITIAKAYYSHPTAWSEIGYSGPSSPRGHVRIWIGGVDPWEPHERATLWKTE
jgi:hypothetical protein